MQGKKEFKRNIISNSCGIIAKDINTSDRNARRRAGKGAKEILEVIMPEHFPELRTDSKLQTLVLEEHQAG
jgi:hypothetical protein